MSAQFSTSMFIILAVLQLGAGCASGPAIKNQRYASLQTQRTFDDEFGVVWKGIETTLRNYTITDRDPEELTPLELAKVSRRLIETDWVYSLSRDKYLEYKVNGLPQKKYLQVRLRYVVVAERVLGGTLVKVQVDEEVEKLNLDGTSAGYAKSEAPDSSRANEILDRIRMAMLSVAP